MNCCIEFLLFGVEAGIFKVTEKTFFPRNCC